jgi:hypothetical protein
LAEKLVIIAENSDHNIHPKCIADFLQESFFEIWLFSVRVYIYLHTYVICTYKHVHSWRPLLEWKFIP